jgi:hypothetical protein
MSGRGSKPTARGLFLRKCLGITLNGLKKSMDILGHQQPVRWPRLESERCGINIIGEAKQK